MTMGFMLKEKLLCFTELPLLSARDIRDWLSFIVIKQQGELDVMNVIMNRHLRRQIDINRHYLKEFS
jgi:hypothetical protein